MNIGMLIVFATLGIGILLLIWIKYYLIKHPELQNKK